MFKFKGISSKEMDVYVTEIDNLIRKAPQRYEEIYIDGRDGAFFHPLGYSPIEVPLELTLMKPERIDEVLQWLNGTGWLEYNGRKTKAHIFSEVEPVRASTVRIIQVTIIRNPFWERVEDSWEEAWGDNLIKNGWDDFEGYGSGENYVTNWDFSKTGNWYDNNLIKKEIKNGTLRIYEGTGNYSNVSQQFTLDPGEYVFRVKKSSKSNVKGVMRVISAKTDKFISLEGEVGEIDFEADGKSSLHFYAQNVLGKPVDGGELVLEWVQVTDLDDQHLVVEKTPLGDGLTRIQTWGGNSIVKLFTPQSNLQKMTTDSVYIKNLNDKPMSVVKNNPYMREYVEDEKYVTLTGLGVASRNNNMQILADDISGNLDFIASEPIIVKGDKAPNWQATSDPAIYNEGTATSKPLIKLEKGKDRQCEFEVNGTYFKFHFNDDGHVILDCEEMEATYNGFNRNRHLTIGFEWPKLKPKENFVKRISGDAKISFKRKDRWL